MRFVDEVSIEMTAGDGGNGCAAFRREKFMPLGGPSGGDGGRGGSIVLEAQPRLGTLIDLRYQRVIRGKRGEDGRGNDQFGAAGEDLTVPVPVGTQVFDAETDELLADLTAPEQRAVVACGGRGGRGNRRLVTRYDRAPRNAEPGEAGEHRKIRLQLKLLADVGVVGFPNAGKSTLIASISRARPKIADYPFTTLVPNLGVVSLGEERSFVIADIPGIIEGASHGAGLGLRFLRHIERTRVLLFVVTISGEPGRDPLSDFHALMHELSTFDPRLATRPRIVGVSKCDLPEVQEALPKLKKDFERLGHALVPFSSARREGLDTLIKNIERILPTA